MSSAILSPVRFGEALIKTGDLDPLYIALVGALDSGTVDRPWVERFLLVYWMFYHSGVAAAIASFPETFWADVAEAVPGTDYPRGRERRHFRGAKAAEAVAALAERYPDPHAALRALVATNRRPVPYTSVARTVAGWPMFGSWIAFKVADMVDRVLGVDVNWDDPAVAGYMYRFPADGATQTVSYYGAEPEPDTIRAALRLLSPLEALSAPPRGDRRVGLAELETVLCKWKAHAAGRYIVGSDTVEIRHHLHWAAPAGFLVDFLPGERLCLYRPPSSQLPLNV